MTRADLQQAAAYEADLREWQRIGRVMQQYLQTPHGAMPPGLLDQVVNRAGRLHVLHALLPLVAEHTALCEQHLADLGIDLTDQ